MRKAALVAVALLAFLFVVPGVFAAKPDVEVTNVALSKSSFNACEPLTVTATIKENWVTEPGEINRGESTDSIDIPTYTVTFYYYRDIMVQPSSAPSTGISKLVTGITNVLKIPSLGKFLEIFAIKPAVTAKTYIWPSKSTNGEKIYKIGEAVVPAHKLWNDPRISNTKTVMFKYWATPDIDNYVIGAFADFSGAVKETDSQRKNNQLEKQLITAASYGRCAPIGALSDGSYATYKMPAPIENTANLTTGQSAYIGDYKITADSIASQDGGAKVQDAFITICKGDKCSASTGFKKGDIRSIYYDPNWLNSESVGIKLASIAWGNSIKVEITYPPILGNRTFKVYTNGGKDDMNANMVFENIDEITTPNGTYAPGKYKWSYSICESDKIGCAGTFGVLIKTATNAERIMKVINVEATKNGTVTNAQVCIYEPRNVLYLTNPNGGEISTGNIQISWCTDSHLGWGFSGPVNIGYVSTDPNVILAHGSDPARVKSIVGNVVNKPMNNPYIWDGKGDKNGPFNKKRLPTGKYKIFISDTTGSGFVDESDSEFTIAPVLQQAQPG
jgi:hypothetical protein